MAFKHSMVATLLLASLVCCSHPSELSRDQYRVRRDKLELPEATDRPIHNAGGNSPIIYAKITNDVESTPDRFEMNIKPKSNSRRKKRSYYSWRKNSIHTPQFENSITSWKAPTYALSRPYYVPIYGVSGRVPIYFPPQPLLINPGTPPDNKNPFKGPPYLPPYPSMPTTSSTTMKTMNRFGEDGDEDDDRPVWGQSGESNPPGMQLSNNFVSQTPGVVPTRRPSGGRTTTFPPLVHDVSPGGASGNGVQRQTTTTSRPAADPIQQPPPSNCVWAIVSCCSATSADVPYKCFEQRGCSGAFWGRSPCETDFARAAIEAALNYYNSE